MSIKLGIGSWSYPWAIGVEGYPRPARPLSVFDLLGKAEVLGVGVVQYCNNLPLTKLDPQEIADLHDRAGKAGISIEVGTKGLESANLMQHLEIALQLEAGLVRTIITSREYQHDLEKAVRQIKKVIPAYEKEGISLALENHERLTAKELAWLIREVDNDYLGICLDTVNSFGALENPYQVVQELAPYVINLHFKDFTIERVDHHMGMVIRGCLPGSGRLDINWLIRSVINNNPSGKCFSVILEQWPPFNGNITDTITREDLWVEQGILFLKNKLF